MGDRIQADLTDRGKMVYLVSPLAQEKEVNELCFRKCGMILNQGVTLPTPKGEGQFFVCRTDKCPYEEKSVNLGTAELFGVWEEIVVRKLKEEVK